jgi:hypothetical protein
MRKNYYAMLYVLEMLSKNKYFFIFKNKVHLYKTSKKIINDLE